MTFWNWKRALHPGAAWAFLGALVACNELLGITDFTPGGHDGGTEVGSGSSSGGNSGRDSGEDAGGGDAAEDVVADSAATDVDADSALSYLDADFDGPDRCPPPLCWQGEEILCGLVFNECGISTECSKCPSPLMCGVDHVCVED
jgi:hypothetical protein